MNDFYLELKDRIDANRVKINEPLKNYTFTKTGGNADCLVLPITYEEVQQVIRFAQHTSIPVTILGNGSNVIIRDGGIRGLVINLTAMNDVSRRGNHLIAQSGAKIIDVSRIAYEESLTGLEFACGIPGTVGGAVYMNAGAYGGEVKDVLDDALVVTKEGDLLRLTNEELKFSYRHSIIPEKEYLVLEASFRLNLGNPAAIKEKMDELTFLRESKQPLEYPSCGSVFKRPPGFFAGKLIQDSGLQGVQIGGVQVSTKHAGFMVNVGNGTATDYVQLIHHVQHVVKEKFNVNLETEVKIIGEE
ncbi:UDP-N-acetylmuramate dehydrogenase [Pullulanibacillus sp. KACC 23026]|uniref:UDP-N-acetylmuramate dehydrogenase n=1 Tax=Pullulanibacillus sp. KACC 23026 TaxID=3028315 RepID=UPI0023B1E734|nr:UDP-N-acetylmuramate dehydrogenase [Pullulanibacillus sp. KACC 23026]WEG12130.1 UDP-N-acetylmuramate dehydrogenase [Pullulanibacillus sp. KACC 23026]